MGQVLIQAGPILRHGSGYTTLSDRPWKGSLASRDGAFDTARGKVIIPRAMWFPQPHGTLRHYHTRWTLTLGMGAAEPL